MAGPVRSTCPKRDNGISYKVQFLTSWAVFREVASRFGHKKSRLHTQSAMSSIRDLEL
jgi:hypothetical protein